MTVTSVEEFLKRKQGGPCALCGVPHKPESHCSRPHLANRIVKLLEANSMIPAILEHNKEATETARGLQEIVKRADESHAILMDLLTEHGEAGEEIRNEYLKRLDLWAQGKGHTSHDTSDQPSLFHQENSTSTETETNDSIKLPSGSPSGNAS